MCLLRAFSLSSLPAPTECECVGTPLLPLERSTRLAFTGGMEQVCAKRVTHVSRLLQCAHGAVTKPWKIDHRRCQFFYYLLVSAFYFCSIAMQIIGECTVLKFALESCFLRFSLLCSLQYPGGLILGNNDCAISIKDHNVTRRNSNATNHNGLVECPDSVFCGATCANPACPDWQTKRP